MVFKWRKKRGVKVLTNFKRDIVKTGGMQPQEWSELLWPEEQRAEGGGGALSQPLRGNWLQM